MADYKETIKHYHRSIEQLEDTVDSKNVELRLFESNLQDSITSQVIASSVTCTLVEMIGELLEFERLKGATDKTKASKERLIKLIFETEKLNVMSARLATLKLLNKDLHSAYQRLRVENHILKEQLLQIENAHNF
jgi:hypothetical protein